MNISKDSLSKLYFIQLKYIKIHFENENCFAQEVNYIVLFGVTLKKKIEIRFTEFVFISCCSNIKVYLVSFFSNVEDTFLHWILMNGQ